MSRPGVLVAIGLLVAACGGTQIPQHSGYKGKKPRPWEKAKEIKLGPDSTGKVTTDLDYGAYKRARWFYVQLPDTGNLELSMEVTPGGAGNATDDEEGENMDVAIEIIDPSFAVIAKSDLESEDAHELKKTITAKELDSGKYLVHVYLEGRLDAADLELKATYTRGEKPRKSDFPNQVAFVPELAAIPPFDDTPEKPKVIKITRTTTKTTKTTKTTTTTKPDDDDKGGGGLVQVSITDTQPDGSGGVRITIGGGTGDGLDNGLKGSVVGVKGSGFVTSGCNAATCRASVKANLDDVRNAGAVTIRLK